MANLNQAEDQFWTFAEDYSTLNNTIYQTLKFSGQKPVVGQSWSGKLQLTGSLAPLAQLLGVATEQEIDVTGKITKVDQNIPDMSLTAQHSTSVTIDTLPSLSLKLELTCENSPNTDGGARATAAMGLTSSIPMGGKEIDLSTSFGPSIGIITLQAQLIDPHTKSSNTQLNLSQLQQLANGNPIQELIPSQFDLPGELTIGQWNLAIDPAKKSITSLSMWVFLEPDHVWQVIPGLLSFKGIEFFFTVAHLDTLQLNATLSATLQIADNFTITLGASYPDFTFFGYLDLDEGSSLPKLTDVATTYGYTIEHLDNTSGLQVGGLDMQLAPKQHSFGVNLYLNPGGDGGWTFLTIDSVKFTLENIALSLQHSAGQTVGSIAGTIDIGPSGDPVELDLFAEYSTAEGWTFQGSLGQPVDVQKLIDKYFPDASFLVPSGLTINQVDLTIIIGPDGYQRYEFLLDTSWVVDLNIEVVEFDYPVDAQLTLTYEKENSTATPTKEGIIRGTVKDFIGMDVILELDLKSGITPAYKAFTFILDGELKGTIQKLPHGASSIDITLTQLSLGDIVGRLVRAATSAIDGNGNPTTKGQTLQLPAPWDVLNKISLDHFDLKFGLPAKGSKDPRTIAFDYDINVSLTPLIKIGNISLEYLLPTKTSTQQDRTVLVIPTGHFLTFDFQKYVQDHPWHATRPDTAPPPPGKGNALFDLRFLGAGQRVSLGESPDSVSKAITDMVADFKSTTPQAPLPKTGVNYDPNAGWLLGLHAYLLKPLLDLSIVFNDPNLYGLLIQVGDGLVKGLRFEIMYKKVNDHVGVYYLALTLPDYIRHIELGDADITLPVVKIWIYTNGGFTIDVGFPYHGDFSQSASIQVLPFTGSGGFYFGVLHNQSVSHLPTPKSGSFNPIIIFGLGLQVGVGKDFSAGPFSGGIDATVEGILQGVVAVYNGSTSDSSSPFGKPFYYYIQAVVGLIGKIYAKLDLAIVSASINITIKLQATLALAAHKAAEVSASAELSVSVKVTLHIPFSVHFHHTFSAHMHVSFKIGHDTTAPWDEVSSGDVALLNSGELAEMDGELAPGLVIDHEQLERLALLDTTPWAPTEANWQAPPLSGITKETLNLYFATKFTLAQLDTDRVPQGVALIMIDAPDPKATHDTIMNASSSKLVKQLLLWVFNTYLVSKAKTDPILEANLNADAVESMLEYFEAQDGGLPLPRLSWNDMVYFFTAYTPVHFNDIPTQPPTGFPRSFAAFPMLSNLQLNLPQGDKIKFNVPVVDKTYLTKLQHAFNQPWPTTNGGATGTVPIPKQALTDFLLSDYFQLSIKQGLKQVSSQFKATTLYPTDLTNIASGPDAVTLNEITTHYPEFGQSPQGIAVTNRDVPLHQGATVTLSNVNYTWQQEDTPDEVADRFSLVGATAYANMAVNPQLSYLQLPKGATVAYAGPSGATTYTVKTVDTLQTIARHFGMTGTGQTGVTAMQEMNQWLLWPNLQNESVTKQLFKSGSSIHLPPFPYGVTGTDTLSKIARRYGLTVAEIIAPTGPTGASHYTNNQVPIFPTNNSLTIAQPANLKIDFILEKLEGPTGSPPLKNNFYQHAGAMASHFLLHGLRLPPTSGTVDTDDGRQGLYQLTRQQFGVEGVTVGDQLQLSINDKIPVPDWMSFGPTGATTLVGYPLGITAIQEIEAFKGMTAYSGPSATIEPPVSYHIQPRHFALSEQIPWQSPQRPLGLTAGIIPPPSWKSGDPQPQKTGFVGNYAIWKFPQKLESVLQSDPGPSGVNPTPFVVTNHAHPAAAELTVTPETITPQLWTTMLRVDIKQADISSGATGVTGATGPSLAKPEKAPYIYEVLGTSQSDKQTLENLMTHTKTIEGIYLLYPADSAQKGQNQANISLKSSPEPTSFIINTNLDDGTNGMTATPTGITTLYPGSAAAVEPIGATGITGAPGVTGANMVFMQELWKNDQTHQSGYYLYYEAEKQSLPSYLFAKNPIAEVTLLVTHSVSPVHDAYNLPVYVNSVVLDGKINTQENVLSIAPTGTTPASFDPRYQVKLPTIRPGYIDIEIDRPYPGTPTPTDGKALLEESYTLLEYKVPQQNGWTASPPGMPIGSHQPNGLTATPTHLHYHAAVPVAPLATTHPPAAPTGSTGPTLPHSPYDGVGQDITLDFRFLDIFGNKLAPMPTTLTPAGPTGPWPRLKTFVGYTDNLISVDAWPHVYTDYNITGASGTAAITLEFTFSRRYYYDIYQSAYKKAKENKAKTAQEKTLLVAQADLAKVTQLYYQLAQSDIEVTITSTLEPNTPYTEADTKTALQTFVGDMWGFIGYTVHELKQPTYTPPTEAPANKSAKITVPIDFTKITQMDIFLLTIKLTIERTKDSNINPGFKDVAAVKSVTSVITPKLQPDGTTGPTATSNLNAFAKGLEDALNTSDYQLKVATQLPDQAPQSSADKAHSVSLVRLAKNSGVTGLYYEIDNDPIYYAPKPVATTVLNRAGVRVYKYEKGTTIDKSSFQLKTFSGFDMGALARTFLNAMDDILSPTMATAIAIVAPDKFRQLQLFKSELANTLSTQIAPVFYHTKSTPSSYGMAQARFRDELLIELSRYYKVETIVQCSVDHIRPSNQEYQVNFFGKLAPLGSTALTAPYAFSTSQVALVKGATGTFFTSLFEVNHAPTSKDTDAPVENQVDLPVKANYQITALEHNFRPSPLAGYQDTDWLSFVLPYSVNANTGNPFSFDIPLPLHAYPTPPALQSQVDLPEAPQFGATTTPPPLTLKDALAWDYTYTYRYIGAAQDTISTNVSFNIAPDGLTGSGPSGAAPRSGIRDLATVLLEFTQVYPKIWADLQKEIPSYAKGGSTKTITNDASTAIESFIYLAGQVVDQWASWTEYERKFSYEYEIEQIEDHSDNSLQIKVSKLKNPGPTGTYPHPGVPLPGIYIPGAPYTPKPDPSHNAPTGPTAVTYKYASATGTYLSWDDRDNYPDRQVKFTDLNVFKQENAWAGIAVIRNEDLGENDKPVKIVNDDFIYRTPLVRFVNILNPFLDPAGSLDLSTVTNMPTGPLNGADGYLGVFFNKLFADFPSDLVHLKISGSYQYRLNGPTGSIEGVTTTLPIFTTIPYWYKLDGDNRKDSSFITKVYDKIKGWLDNNPQLKPQIQELDQTLVFDLTVFSSLTSSQLPLLHLREITLSVKKVTDL